MNTKETIEFVNNIPSNGLIFDPLPLENRKKQLIELLQRGEKYEKMWKKFRRVYWKKPNSVEITLDVCNAIERLEQKYFPKPIKDKDYFYEATSKDLHLKKISFKKGGKKC